MIVIDSSVWIDHFNGRSTEQTTRLGVLLDDENLPILVGDIIMYEVLCGFRTAQAAMAARALLEKRLLVTMLGFDLVHRAVENRRTLRAKGATIPTADIFIGTYCIATGAELLTSDRDFLPMREHLGLRLVGSA
jgi:predicted nucleic acid-binding protein